MYISAITADPSIPPREALNPSRLEQFAQILESGDELTPVTVFFDGQVHWLADGFHRYEAYIKTGRTDIPAKIQQGTLRDAILCGIRSNAHHGIGLSRDERRNAVWRLLSDPEWQDWSSRKIGRLCGLNHETVEKIKLNYSLQSVSGDFRQIHSVTNLPDIRRFSRNGKDHSIDVSQNKSRKSSKKTVSVPRPNVIDITHLTQTVHDSLSPSLNNTSGAFIIHSVQFEEPLISDNQYELNFKVLTSGPSYAMPMIFDMMRDFPPFAQYVYRQARILAAQTNGAV